MSRKIKIDTAQRRAWAAQEVSKLPLEPIHEITIREHADTRSIAQNRLMWDMLTAISKQVEWDGQKLSPEDWKDVISSALQQQTRVVRGLEGGIVILGARTSKMKVKEMSEMIEYCEHFGGANGVKFKATIDYDLIS